MISANRVFIIGNLTRDPNIRTLNSGTAVAEVCMALNSKFKGKSGELEESTCFVDVVIWDKQAEACADYLAKGSCVLVEGRLELNSWTTKEGEKRNRLRVRADRVQFISSSNRSKSGNDGKKPESNRADRPDDENEEGHDRDRNTDRRTEREDSRNQRFKKAS